MDERQITVNNRYRLHERLGAGGMGAVYRATDRLTGHTIALKQIRTDLTEGTQQTDETQDLRLSLSREFRTLASLHHPHVVGVLDYGFGAFHDPDEHVPYFTMELVEAARTVTEAGQSAPPDDKARLLIEMLQALAYVHRRGVVHRDLKPANVLVNVAGTVKVLDFGLATGRTIGSLSEINAGLAGTLAYLAPELFYNQPPTAASDLWAVGLIAYELFIGQYPFAKRGNNWAALMHNIMHQDIDFTPLNPALAVVLARLLSRAADHRYQTAEAVITDLCGALGIPIPQESVAMRDSFLRSAQFVGREAPLRTLRHALNRLRGIQRDNTPDATQTDLLPAVAQEEDLLSHHNQRAFLVGGESGVGKSRLLDELRIRALTRGALVLRGHAADGGLPFQVWRDPLRRLLLAVPVSDSEAATLKAIVPDIEALLERPVPDALEHDESARQAQIAQMIVAVVARYHGPLALLLEDLHWALTDDSLQPLRLLVEALDHLPHLLLVGTYRDEEAPTLPKRLPGMALIRLRRLDRAGIAQLSASILGERGLRHDVIDLLARETEGNIFFVVEVVRALAEEAGGLRGVGTGRLPRTVFAGGVQEVVHRRLHQVPARDQEALRLAAVAGRQLDLPVLAQALTGSANETGALSPFLTACANAAVLEVIDGAWRFSHDKLREALLAELHPDEQAALHQQVAEAMEQVYPDDPARAVALMEHWHLAGDALREAQYALAAGRQAEVVSNFAQALALAERGLGLARDDALRMTLLDLAGDALYSLSDYAAARARYEQSLTLARSIDSAAGTAVALRGLGRVAAAYGDYASARDRYTECLGIYRAIDDQRGIASCLNRLGGIADIQADYATAQHCYEESLAIYRALGNWRGVASSLNRLGVTAVRQGALREAQRYLEEGVTLYRQIGDRRGIAACLIGLGELAIHSNQPRAAVDYLEQSLALYREIGDWRGSVAVLCSLAQAHLFLLGPPAARADIGEALRIARTLHLPGMKLQAITGMARIAVLMGDPQDAAALAGLVDAHPAATPELRLLRLRPLLDDLAGLLPADALPALLAQGHGRDLDTVIDRLLEGFA